MHIGIAGPILTDSLKNYLELPQKHPKGLGGSSVNNLVIGLLKLGHKVSVYTLDIEVKEPIVLNGSQLKIYFGEYREIGRSRMLDFFYKESQQIKKFILIDKPEIVNAHWGYEFAIGTIKSNYPKLITLRDAPKEILYIKKDLYRFIRYLMNLWVMRHGINFSVNSPYLKKKLEYFNIDMEIIPNFITEVKNSLKLKDFNETINFVSVLNGWGEIKNPINALKAFKLLRKTYKLKLEYHLFGPDYERTGIAEEWAKSNGYDSNVFFHGNVNHSLLMDELDNFDIMIHPAIEESFGNTLIEAMGQGIPVIGGKNAGAVPWVLNYGRSGVLVDVTKPVEIYSGVILLIENKEFYNKLRHNALQYVKDNFHINVVVNKYIELYSKILSQND